MSQAENQNVGLTAQITELGMQEFVNQIGSLLTGLKAVNGELNKFAQLPDSLRQSAKEMGALQKLTSAMGTSISTMKNLSNQNRDFDALRSFDSSSRFGLSPTQRPNRLDLNASTKSLQATEQAGATNVAANERLLKQLGEAQANGKKKLIELEKEIAAQLQAQLTIAKMERAEYKSPKGKNAQRLDAEIATITQQLNGQLKSNPVYAAANSEYQQISKARTEASNAIIRGERRLASIREELLNRENIEIQKAILQRQEETKQRTQSRIQSGRAEQEHNYQVQQSKDALAAKTNAEKAFQAASDARNKQGMTEYNRNQTYAKEQLAFAGSQRILNSALGQTAPIAGMDLGEIRRQKQRATAGLNQFELEKGAGIDRTKEIQTAKNVIALLEAELKLRKDIEQTAKAQMKLSDAYAANPSKATADFFNSNNKQLAVNEVDNKNRARLAREQSRQNASNVASGTSSMSEAAVRATNPAVISAYTSELKKLLQVETQLGNSNRAAALDKELKAVEAITKAIREEAAEIARLNTAQQRVANDTTGKRAATAGKDVSLSAYQQRLNTTGSIGITGNESRTENKLMQEALQIQLKILTGQNAINGAHTQTIKSLEQEAQLLRQQETAQKGGAKQSATSKRAAELLGGGGGDLFAVQAMLQVNYAIQNAITAPFVTAMKYIKEFQLELANFKAISQATDQEVKSLGQNVERLAGIYKFSGQTIAQAATQLAQAGLSANEVQQALEGVVKMAVASGTSLADSVQLATSVIGVFNYTADQTEQVANKIAVAMNDSKATVSQFAVALQYVGNTAADAKVPFDELLAAAGGLANAGIKSGSTIGTGLRQLITEFEAPTDRFAKNLKLVGLTVDDVNIKTKGLTGVLSTLKEAGFGGSNALNSFEIRSAATFTALSNNLEQVGKLQESILTKNALDPAVAAQTETLAATTERLSNVFSALVSNSLQPLVSVVTTVLGVFADFIGGINTLMVQVPALGNVLKVVTSLMGAFLAVMAAEHLLAMNRALMLTIASIHATSAAAAGGTVSLTIFQRALTLVSMFPWIAAGTALAVVLTTVIATMANGTKTIEDHKTALNELNGEVSQTQQQINGLESRYGDLYQKQDTLTKGSHELKLAILQANNDFGALGVTVNSTSGSFDDLTKSIARATGALRMHLQQKQVDAAYEQAALYDLTEKKFKKSESDFYTNKSQGGKGRYDSEVNSVKDPVERKKLIEVLNIIERKRSGQEMTDLESATLKHFNTSKSLNSFGTNGLNNFITGAQTIAKEKDALTSMKYANYDAAQIVKNNERVSNVTGAPQLQAQIREVSSRVPTQAITDVAASQKSYKELTAELNALRKQAAKPEFRAVKDVFTAAIDDAAAKLNSVNNTSQSKQAETAQKANRVVVDNLKLDYQAAVASKNPKAAKAAGEAMAEQTSLGKLMETFPLYVAANGKRGNESRLRVLDETEAKQKIEALPKDKQTGALADYEKLKIIHADNVKKSGELGAIKATPRGQKTFDGAAKDESKALNDLASAYEKQAATIEKSAKLEKEDLGTVQLAKKAAMEALDKAHEAKLKSIEVSSTESAKMNGSDNEKVISAKRIAIEAAEIEYRERRIAAAQNFAAMEEKLAASSIAMRDALDVSSKATKTFEAAMTKAADGVESLDFKALKTRMSLFGNQYGEADNILANKQERENTFTKANLQAPIVQGQIELQQGVSNVVKDSVSSANVDLSAADAQVLAAKEALSGTDSNGREKAQRDLDEALIRQEASRKRVVEWSEKQVEVDTRILGLQKEMGNIDAIQSSNFQNRDTGNFLDDLAKSWEIATAAAREYNATQSNVGDVATGLYGVLQNSGNAFAANFSAIARGAKTGKEAMRDFAVSVLESMAKVVEAELAKQFMKLILGMAGSLFGGSVMAGGDFMNSGGGGSSALFGSTHQANLWHGGAVRFAGGGAVSGNIKTRDSVNAILAPEEVVLNQKAVKSIGMSTALDINSRGAEALKGLGNNTVVNQEQKEVTMNVWVVTPDNQPSGMGANDVVTIVADNISRGGSIKQLIKTVVA